MSGRDDGGLSATAYRQAGWAEYFAGTGRWGYTGRSRVLGGFIRINSSNMEETTQGMGEQGTQPQAPMGNTSDAEQNKVMAIVGYLIPLLFFVPLVTDAKNSPFAKFHANQQLVLLIAGIVVNVVGTIIPFIGWFIILPLGAIALIVIAIIGIINAAKGEMKQLPLIGGFSIIK